MLLVQSAPSSAMSRRPSVAAHPSPLSHSSTRYAEFRDISLSSSSNSPTSTSLHSVPLAEAPSAMAAVAQPIALRTGIGRSQWPMSSRSSRSASTTDMSIDYSQSLPSCGFSSNTTITSASMVSSPSAWRVAHPSTRSVRDRSLSPPPRSVPSATMVDTISSNSSRSPSLIRRLSRGASNRLRRRASNQQSLRMRDQSAGPVLIRRRSDSTGAADLAQDVSDLELDNPGEEDAIDELGFASRSHHHSHNAYHHISNISTGLGIAPGRTSNASSHFEGGIAASTSAILQNGTWVWKLTPKKQKRMYIWLDPNTARVCWHSTNSAKSFFIDDVREMRVGAESRNMRDDIKIPEDREHLAVSLVCDMPQRSKGASIKTMHFLMPDEFVYKHWTDALSAVTRDRMEVMNALSPSLDKSERSMRMAWQLIKGMNTDQFFTLEDARWACSMLEINCSDHAVRTHFTRSDTYNTGNLTYAQYMDFIASFKERKDIQNLYRNIKLGTDLDMDLESFLEFLRVEQCADVVGDRAYWESVYERFARPGLRGLSMQGFQNFLTSPYNSALISYKASAYFDRPLNEYFISSSHNTYLLGRQVRGESSVEGYISTLIKGCRCVEIDCWDGDNGRPMVTHGRTLTSRVPFEDCVSVIAKYAFHTSPYPLIVSLEVHCNPEQQRAMVDLMIKYFDGMMVTEPITPDCSTLPSPEELKKRILIKVKAAEEPESVSSTATNAANGRNRARSVGSMMSAAPPVLPPPNFESHAASISSILSNLPPTSPSETTADSISTPRGSIASGPTSTPSTSSSDNDDALPSYEKPKRRKTSKIVPELGRLGVYTQGIGYDGFNTPEARTSNHVFSLNETTFAKLSSKTSDTKPALEKHNQRHLMRVYPAAKRFDSSNFDPLQTWRRGVQMAALNWQTYDTYQQINTAMFAAGSDHFGYVLKPVELRHSKHTDGPDAKDRPGKKLVKFTVDIISAQRLPRPKTNSAERAPMNPFIVFEMYSAEDRASDVARGEGGTDASARYGSSGIGSPLRKRTKIVECNGFDPIYNESIGLTVVTKYPDLIFVRWTVHNSPEARSTASTNSGPLAVFTAKLNNLQQGYRHLPLFNDYGEQYRDAKLFVRIRKEAPVPLLQDESHSTGNLASMDTAQPSPRPEPVKSERSWRSRVFSRQPSQRRPKVDDETQVGIGAISRTQSVEIDGSR